MYPQITQISQIVLDKGQPSRLLCRFKMLTEAREGAPELSPA